MKRARSRSWSRGHGVSRPRSRERPRFRELVVQFVEEDISFVVASGWRRDAGARYVAGALVELLAWWVEAGGRHSPDDIERYFRQLTAPVIDQLGQSGKASTPIPDAPLSRLT